MGSSPKVDLSMADGPHDVVSERPILRPWPPFGLRFPSFFPTVLKKRFVRRYGHFLLFSFKKPRVSRLFPTSPGSPDRRQSEPTSLYETGLKIRWTYHPCGFESHHRHHETPVFAGVSSFFYSKPPFISVAFALAKILFSGFFILHFSRNYGHFRAYGGRFGGRW